MYFDFLDTILIQTYIDLSSNNITRFDSSVFYEILEHYQKFPEFTMYYTRTINLDNSKSS